MHRSVSTLHPHVGCNKKHPPRCDWKEISAQSELWILVTSRCVRIFYTSIQPINVSFWFWTHSFPMDKYCSMLVKNKSIVYIYIYISGEKKLTFWEQKPYPPGNVLFIYFLFIHLFIYFGGSTALSENDFLTETKGLSLNMSWDFHKSNRRNILFQLAFPQDNSALFYYTFIIWRRITGGVLITEHMHWQA